jgi:ACR3 family arsenite efflux pump ArsB
MPFAASRVALQLVTHFVVMFFVSFGLTISMKLPYELAVTQSFS